MIRAAMMSAARLRSALLVRSAPLQSQHPRCFSGAPLPPPSSLPPLVNFQNAATPNSPSKSSWPSTLPPTPPPSTPPPPPPPASRKSRMADIATTTFLCSTALSALSLTSLTTAHLCGVDFNAVIAFIVKHVPALDAVASKLDPALGTVAAILIVHKLWAPIRWSMAAAATPFFLPLYRRKLKPWWKKVVHNWRAGKK